MHPVRIALAVCLLLGVGLPVAAQQEGEYFHEVLPDGTVRFTQVLRWDGDPNAWCYDVTVQTADGAEVLATRVTEPVLHLSLGPGEYRYHVVMYNLLRKPEVELPWQDLEVIKAEQPAIAHSAPARWFLEDPDPCLSLTGQNILGGATVTLRPHDEGEEPVTGKETACDGATSMSVTFPVRALTAGAYSLVIANPGGLSQTIADALVLLHKLPLAEGLSPTSGTIIGPAELRAARTLTFSWDPVPGATRYLFSLSRDGDAQPLVPPTALVGTTWVLDDLTPLDRGAFRWSVQAQGETPDGAIIPAVGVSEAQFQVDLPRLAAPTLQAGDAFYGS